MVMDAFMTLGKLTTLSGTRSPNPSNPSSQGKLTDVEAFHQSTHGKQNDGRYIDLSKKHCIGRSQPFKPRSLRLSRQTAHSQSPVGIEWLEAIVGLELRAQSYRLIKSGGIFLCATTSKR